MDPLDGRSIFPSSRTIPMRAQNSVNGIDYTSYTNEDHNLPESAQMTQQAYERFQAREEIEAPIRRLKEIKVYRDLCQINTNTPSAGDEIIRLFNEAKLEGCLDIRSLITVCDRYSWWYKGLPDGVQPNHNLDSLWEEITLSMNDFDEVGLPKIFCAAVSCHCDQNLVNALAGRIIRMERCLSGFLTTQVFLVFNYYHLKHDQLFETLCNRIQTCPDLFDQENINNLLKCCVDVGISKPAVLQSLVNQATNLAEKIPGKRAIEIAHLCAPLRHINKSLMSRLIPAIVNYIPQASDSQLGMIANSYSNLGINIDEIEKAIRLEVMFSRRSFNEQSFSSIVSAFARWQSKDWKLGWSLIDHAKNLKQVSARDAFAISWAFAMLDINSVDVFKNLLSSLKAHECNDVRCVTMLAQVLDYLQVRNIILDMDPEVLELMRTYRPSSTASKLHTSVFNYLKDMNLDVCAEYLIGRSCCVDIAIPSHKLVIEVDGPTHYYKAMQEAFREKILHYFGWRVIHIKFDEWNMKSYQDRDRMLQQLLLAAGVNIQSSFGPQRRQSTIIESKPASFELPKARVSGDCINLNKAICCVKMDRNDAPFEILDLFTLGKKRSHLDAVVVSTVWHKLGFWCQKNEKTLPANIDLTELVQATREYLGVTRSRNLASIIWAFGQLKLKDKKLARDVLAFTKGQILLMEATSLSALANGLTNLLLYDEEALKAILQRLAAIPPDAASIANVLKACVTFQYVDSELLKKIQQKTIMLKEASSVEISMIALSLSKLSKTIDLYDKKQLASAIAKLALVKQSCWTDVNISNLILAFGTLKVNESKLIGELVNRSKEIAYKLNEQCLANIVSGLSKLDLFYPKTMKSFANRAIELAPGLNPIALCAITNSFSSLNYNDSSFFKPLYERAIELVNSNKVDGRGLVILLRAYAKADVKHPIGNTLIEKIDLYVETMKSQEIVHTLWALSLLDSDDNELFQKAIARINTLDIDHKAEIGSLALVMDFIEMKGFTNCNLRPDLVAAVKYCSACDENIESFPEICTLLKKFDVECQNQTLIGHSVRSGILIPSLKKAILMIAKSTSSSTNRFRERVLEFYGYQVVNILMREWYDLSQDDKEGYLLSIIGR